MKIICLLLLCALSLYVSAKSLREFLPSYANQLDNMFEAIEEHDPCHYHNCDFPSRCITIPNTACIECPDVAMCAHFG